MSSASENWHRRQAVQLAIYLPEEREDALKIVDCLNDLIGYIYGYPPEGAPSGGLPGEGSDQILRFPGGSSSPSRRRSSVGRASILPK